MARGDIGGGCERAAWERRHWGCSFFSGEVSSAPSTKCIFALPGVLVPPSEPLLAQLHLVFVGFLTFFLDLSIIGVALFAASSSLADTCKGGSEN